MAADGHGHWAHTEVGVGDLAKVFTVKIWKGTSTVKATFLVEGGPGAKVGGSNQFQSRSSSKRINDTSLVRSKVQVDVQFKLKENEFNSEYSNLVEALQWSWDVWKK